VKMRFLMAAAAILLLGGCGGDGYFGVFGGPYLGGFGPYYSGGWFHGGDFVDRGAHYYNYSGGHHFVGHTVAARHYGEAIPKPISQTLPVAEFTSTLAGLMSLWIVPR
jgi:hypothetical protein